jgi:hypothetical protein
LVNLVKRLDPKNAIGNRRLTRNLEKKILTTRMIFKSPLIFLFSVSSGELYSEYGNHLKNKEVFFSPQKSQTV